MHRQQADSPKLPKGEHLNNAKDHCVLLCERACANCKLQRCRLPTKVTRTGSRKAVMLLLMDRCELYVLSARASPTYIPLACSWLRVRLHSQCLNSCASCPAMPEHIPALSKPHTLGCQTASQVAYVATGLPGNLIMCKKTIPWNTDSTSNSQTPCGLSSLQLALDTVAECCM